MKDHDALSALFRAEQHEAPPPLTVERGLARLDASLKAGVPSMPVASGPLTLGTSAVLPWLAAGALTALVGGAWWLLTPPTPTPSGSPARGVASSEARAVAPAPVVSPAPPAPRPNERDPERKPEPSREPSTPEPRPSAIERTEGTSTFAEELRLIRFAKQALDRGNGPLAERWLAMHRERFPSGVFSGEREALTILVGCGRSPEAGRERARRFVAQNPASPLVDRIERACKFGSTDHGKSAPSLEDK